MNSERTPEQKARDREFVKGLFEKYYPRRAAELRLQEEKRQVTASGDNRALKQEG